MTKPPKTRRARPAAQVAPATADAIWQAWREIRSTLPMWKMPIDALFSRSAWSLLGVDYISGLRNSAPARTIFAVLGRLAPGDMRRVHALAQINQRRQDVISRWTAIGFFTLPLSLGLALAQLRPTLFERLVEEWDLATLNTLGVIGLIVGYILACAWRARQIAAVVELGLIEHAVSFDLGADDADPPHSPSL